MATIVVGIDGSEGSAAALRWAGAEARLRGAQLEVVSCWDVPPMMYDAPGQVMPIDVNPETFESAGERVLDAALERARPELEGLTVTRTLRGGRAEDVLVAAAVEADAELLVVGSRGHGGLTGLLLGSVSHHVAQHAPCPVVIVRHPRHAD
jgi:nucleotide-binding universal stress UspA family protein